MASWIVHLRIAENLLAVIGGLDTDLFSIGNIAPDSGIPDEKWEHFDPPTRVTHFEVSDFTEDPDVFRTSDLAFFNQYLLPLRAEANPDPLRCTFLLGYFFHLLTDNNWVRRIARLTRARYPQQFAADKDFIWEVKDDWYGLDHVYVRDHPQSLFWRIFMRVGYERADLDFLPARAVQERIRYIQNYYSQPDERVERMMARPFIYLSQAEMDAFVQDTTRLILACYRLLWLQGVSPDGHVSALELV